MFYIDLLVSSAYTTHTQTCYDVKFLPPCEPSTLVVRTVRSVAVGCHGFESAETQHLPLFFVASERCDYFAFNIFRLSPTPPSLRLFTVIRYHRNWDWATGQEPQFPNGGVGGGTEESAKNISDTWRNERALRTIARVVRKRWKGHNCLSFQWSKPSAKCPQTYTLPSRGLHRTSTCRTTLFDF